VIHNARAAALEEEYFLTLPGADPVRVARRGGGHCQIRIEERFAIVRSSIESAAAEYTVATRKYAYTLDDDGGKEILAFHWHSREQGFDLPHLHVSAGAGQLVDVFHRAHIPTGRVALSDFVAFLIRDFDVTARDPSYRRVLQRSMAAGEEPWGSE
jgi:hypothetical protein